MAGAFGGGGDMGTVFGGRGAATFLSRLTTGLAVAFLVLSLIISFLNRGGTDTGSLVQQEQQRRATVPATGLPVVPTGDAQSLLPLESGGEASTPAVDTVQ